MPNPSFSKHPVLAGFLTLAEAYSDSLVLSSACSCVACFCYFMREKFFVTKILGVFCIYSFFRWLSFMGEFLLSYLKDLPDLLPFSKRLFPPPYSYWVICQTKQYLGSGMSSKRFSRRISLISSRLITFCFMLWSLVSMNTNEPLSKCN